MTIHYHGTPITPRSELLRLAGRNFAVSFARPEDMKVCHEIGQSVMLDNGAFSHWTKGRSPNWKDYYVWCETLLEYQTTWAIIPDVIDGDESANDALLKQWPFGDRGAPVWHMHESIDRLERLCADWPRVCIGSSGVYRTVGSPGWHGRLTKAMNRICGDGPPPVWLHMLRGMSLAGGRYPFASLDSTDVARNHNRLQNSVTKLADRWDRAQCPSRWYFVPEQPLLLSEAS